MVLLVVFTCCGSYLFPLPQRTVKTTHHPTRTPERRRTDGYFLFFPSVYFLVFSFNHALLIFLWRGCNGRQVNPGVKGKKRQRGNQTDGWSHRSFSHRSFFFLAMRGVDRWDRWSGSFTDHPTVCLSSLAQYFPFINHLSFLPAVHLFSHCLFPFRWCPLSFYTN